LTQTVIQLGQSFRSSGLRARVGRAPHSLSLPV